MTTTTQTQVKTMDGDALLYPQDFCKPAAYRGILITPEVACAILEFSQDDFTNRRQEYKRLTAYAAEMKAGRWRLNGEAVIFDKDGVMINGYTRVGAAFAHGATFVTAAQCGIDRAAYTTIDIGRGKSMADMLSIGGEDRAHTVAGALPWVWRYSRRDMQLRVTTTAWPFYQRQEFLAQHPDLRASIAPTQTARQKRLASPGVIVATHYITARESASDADAFFKLLGDGVGYSARSPIHALRERLLNDTHLPSDDRLLLILLAWQKWREGQTCVRLQVPAELPEIEGWQAQRQSRK